MSEITVPNQIIIREDYIDATERLALLAEKMHKGHTIPTDHVEKCVLRWRKLRSAIVRGKETK
jgi:hypothetical protein